MTITKQFVGDPIDRALSAYFRTGGAFVDRPSLHGVEEVEHDGRQYVTLSNNYRTLAVYRVLTDGALKRLSRWPAAVADQLTNRRQRPTPVSYTHLRAH